MTLTDNFTDIIIKTFKGLPLKTQFKLREEECMGLDIEDFVYEDYAYVLNLANQIGVKIGEAIVYCEECDDEFENIKINTDTFEWTCPECGNVDNQ